MEGPAPTQLAGPHAPAAGSWAQGDRWESAQDSGHRRARGRPTLPRAQPPPTCRRAHGHTLIRATCTHTELRHSHAVCDALSSVQMQTTPTLPTPTHPGHTQGQPASFFPLVPSPRLGGVSVPLPGRHMWFQLAAERAFPSQTAGPCQGPGPAGTHSKGHFNPPLLHWPYRGPQRALSPGKPRYPLPRFPLTWSRNPHPLVQGPATPGASGHHDCQPASPLSLCLGAEAELDGRRAGCQGGGREGGEGACGNETLITEPLLFPSIWDISYILKTLAVYIFKGSG